MMLKFLRNNSLNLYIIMNILNKFWSRLHPRTQRALYFLAIPILSFVIVMVGIPLAMIGLLTWVFVGLVVLGFSPFYWIWTGKNIYKTVNWVDRFYNDFLS